MTTTKFIRGQVHHPAVVALLTEHLADMFANSPAESVHALDLTALCQPEIQFWSLWSSSDQLLGCVAIKTLNSNEAELKSMRTASHLRGQGFGKQLLEHALQSAKAAGFTRLSLETGSMAFFAPARQLYLQYGFEPCGPFGDYQLDPNSVFMSRLL